MCICLSLHVFNLTQHHNDIEHKVHKVILSLGMRESHSNMSIKIFLASVSDICMLYEYFKICRLLQAITNKTLVQLKSARDFKKPKMSVFMSFPSLIHSVYASLPYWIGEGGVCVHMQVCMCTYLCTKCTNLVTIRAVDFKMKRDRHRCPVQAKKKSSF